MDSCDLPQCYAFSLCHANNGAPSGWPSHESRYVESILFESSGQMRAVEAPRPAAFNIFDRIEIYTINDVVGLGMRTKGSPSEIVFRKDEFVGTYCGTMLNLELWFGIDVGTYIIRTKSNVKNTAINARGYGDYTRLFHHSHNRANLTVLSSQHSVSPSGGTFTVWPSEFWTRCDIMGGEQLTFSYATQYHDEIDVAPARTALSTQPTERAAKVGPKKQQPRHATKRLKEDEPSV